MKRKYVMVRGGGGGRVEKGKKNPGGGENERPKGVEPEKKDGRWGRREGGGRGLHYASESEGLVVSVVCASLP